MSMEVNVFFSGKLPGTAALMRCFKELGFPLTFPRGTGALEKHGSGYMPMRLRGEESGIELYTHDRREELDEDFEIDVDPRFTRSANFRWSSSADECVVAYCFAGALAKLTNGMVFDVDGETLLTADETIARARNDLKNMTPAKQPATSPADVRCYLASLLKQRNDLALVGRRLFIRPVRHLLRSAFLDRTSDKYSFRLSRNCKPLYASGGSVGADLHNGAFEVWQPHFEPLLMATLGEVFKELGRKTTLADFASQSEGSTSFLFARITSLVLAGERDQAAALAEEIGREYDLATEMQTHWKHLSANIERTCAECHAKEAETVKALKLERFWEPSPFPVELPVSARAGKVDEVAFPTEPWPAPPSWLWQELPQVPDELRYAERDLGRKGGVLLVALTPAQAEERHRLQEGYVLAARLTDGLLVLIARTTSWDRRQPRDFPFRGAPSDPDVHLSLHGRLQWAHCSTSLADDDRDVIRLNYLSVHEQSGSGEIWYCSTDFEEGVRRVWDDRSGERVLRDTTVSASERELATCPIPAFGEYAEIVDRFRALLRATGFGEVS